MIRVSRENAGARAAFLLVLAAALVIPSLAWPGAAAVSNYRGLAIQLVALGLLVLLVPRQGWTRENVSRFLRTGPNLAILAFVAWMGVAYLRSPSSVNSYALQQLLLAVGGAVIYFALVYRLPQRRSLQKIVAGLAVAVILSVVIASLTYSKGSLAGAFGNPQLMASFLLLMLPLLLVTAQSEDNPGRRIAAQFATVFAVAALLFTMNRSAWGGAVVALVVMGALALRYATGGRGLAQNKQFILMPALVVVAAIGIFFALGGSNSGILNRIATLSGSATSEGSWNWRLDSWGAAYKMFLNSPVIGQGLGAYAATSANYGAPSLSPIVNRGLTPSMTDMPHNQYLLLLSETGLLGLMLYLGVIVGFFVHCGKALGETTSHTRRWLLIGAMAAIAGQVVDAFNNPAYQFADVNLFFWLVMGIGVAASRPRDEREAEVVAPAASRSRTLRFPARAAWACAQVGMLAAGLFGIGTAYAGNDKFIPPGYETVRGCRVNPISQTLLLPQPKTPGTTRCITYRMVVSFSFGNGPQQSFDMTNDPNTTWSESSGGCVFQQDKGVFCWTRPVGQSCIKQNFQVTANYQLGDFFCASTATLRTGP